VLNVKSTYVSDFTPVSSDFHLRVTKHLQSATAAQQVTYLPQSKRRLGIETARLRTGRAVGHMLCELGQILHVVTGSVNGRKMRA
jgi:hypothetical protein